MKVATKDLPKDEFKAPKSAKYAMVRGIREAFRPGTEPRAAAPSGPAALTGPQPYNQVWPDGVVTGAPSSGQAVPPPKKADDMSGLY